MYTVKISNETAESMFRDILIQDYQRLKWNIDELEQRLEDLKPYEFEDLCNDRRWRDACEVMMEYYLPHDQMKELVGEDPTSQ